MIGIDGWSGSGKTTVADAVAARLGAAVVHVDDLVPGWHGLAESVRLLVDTVLRPLAAGDRARWPVWDWETESYAGERSVEPLGVVVVEGCGAGAPPARPYLSGLVWIDSGSDERRRRLEARPDWPTYRRWWRTWSDQEAELRRSDDPGAHADVVVTWADDQPVAHVANRPGAVRGWDEPSTQGEIVALSFDPEFGEALAAYAATAGERPPPPAPGDWAARRANVDAVLRVVAEQLGLPDGVTVEDASAEGPDGPVPLKVIRPADAGRGIAVHMHGGGMIAGTAASMVSLTARSAAGAGITVVSVEYRLAPEHPFPAGVEDAYAALQWTAAHTAELGADPGRLGVMGESAGGGLAAAVALMARDRGGPAIALQALVYPMLDDRTVIPDDALAGLPLTWTYDDNVTGWGALLGAADRGTEVSPYAAPARAVDLAGLPPAYIEVGGLDIFRNEDIAYAGRLSAAGVPTELHVHAGVPHAFELFGPATAVARRAVADRMRVLATLNR